MININKVVCVCLVIVFFSANLLAQPKVEVAHWWTSKGEAKAVGVIIQAFEKKGYQWVDSAIEGGGGDALINTLRARLTAGTPPVAVQMYMGPNVWRWGEEGALENLDAIAEAAGWRNVLPPLINRMVQYGNHYVAVPINAHRVNWMWINPDVFRLAQAKVPTTWNEFYEAAEKIQSKGFIPVALGGQPWQEATLFESVLLGIGGVKFHREAIIELKQDALNSPTMVKVFETMRRIKKYTDKDAPGRTWDEATEMVMGGRAAIQFMGDWAKGEFLAAGKQPGIDFLCLPSLETNSVFLIDTDTFAMFKVKDKDSQTAQKELAKIVMDPEVQKQFNLIKGSIPARMDIPRSGFDKCACAAMDAFIAAASRDSIVPAFSYAQANSPDIQKVMIDFYPTEKRLYLDIHVPLVNQSMGQSKDEIDKKSYGFAYIGLQYGVIRSFVELTADWIGNLEKETGVNLDIFLADGRHGLGDLDAVPGQLNLSGLLAEDRIFKINLKDEEYLAAITAIKIDGKHLGYLVTSIRADYLTNQIRNTAFTLLGIGLASLVLFIPLAFLLAYFYVRPVLDLEKNADQVARGNLAVEIKTNRKDEVGSLARSFANMRDSVRKKIDDLKQLNTELFQAKNELEQFSYNLEQKVKERTEELSRSEQSLAHSQRIARLGSWSWDILSDKVTWSDEVYRIFGVAPRRFSATCEAFLQFIHPDDREMVQKAVRAALYEKSEYNIDHRIVLSDKSEWIVHEEGQVTFDESDQPIKFVGIIQDVSEQKKAMLELENAKRLADQANQAKSNFLASMSHELRTPLNAILGFSQLIARSHNLDAQDKKNLQIINRSGEHLLTLINDVLNMSKIESGRLTLNESDFDLYRMLDDVRNICRVQSEKKGLKLQFAREPEVPQFVRTDETRLRQVLVNLINNAVKFTNNGGVAVRTRCGTVTNPSDGIAHITFEIEDTGIGIEPDMLDQVFNPFVQDMAGTISGEGTGLGLPISRRIARLMHGDITAASTMGQGSLFTVTIQLNTRRHTDVQPRQAEQRILGLQYVFEETANPDEPTSIQKNEQIRDHIQDLPLEWRAALKEAVELSDHNKMCSLTLQIHDQHTFVASMIQERIDQFDYDTILDILDTEVG